MSVGDYILAVLSLSCLVLSLNGCKEGGCGEDEPASSEATEIPSETSIPVEAAIGGLSRHRDGSLASEPVDQPPSLDTLTTPSRCPYLLNPVSWRYRSVRYHGDQAVSEATVAMTTTWERETFDDLGALFKVVLKIHILGPDNRFQDDPVTDTYESRYALLTPRGLRLSRPNAHFDEHAEAIRVLSEAPQAWPLPGQEGCHHQAGNFALPFGQARGIRIECPNLESELGRSQVTTVWVDRVGFVYREVRPLDDNPERMVFRDFLVDSDVIELATPPRGDDLVVLLP